MPSALSMPLLPRLEDPGFAYFKQAGTCSRRHRISLSCWSAVIAFCRCAICCACAAGATAQTRATVVVPMPSAWSACAVHRCGYWIPLWISIRFIGTVMCGNSTSGARKRPRARSGSDLTPSILRCSKMGLQANSGVFSAGFHLSLSIARGLSNLYISMSSLLCKYLHREKNMYLTSRFIVFPGVNIFI